MVSDLKGLEGGWMDGWREGGRWMEGGREGGMDGQQSGPSR